MPSDLIERIWRLICKVAEGEEGYGTVTVVVEKREVARILCSTDVLLKPRLKVSTKTK